MGRRRINLTSIVSVSPVAGSFEALNDDKGNLYIRLENKEYVFHYNEGKLNLDSVKTIRPKK